MNKYKSQGKITLFDSENTQQKLSNLGNLCCFQAVPWFGKRRQGARFTYDMAVSGTVAKKIMLTVRMWVRKKYMRDIT